FAYRAAVEAPVLLKNEGSVLPLKGGRILLVGPNADCIPFGGGSGAMYPYKKYETTLYQGLKNSGCKVDLRADVPADPAELKGIGTIICAVGFNSQTEKENSDRSYSLDKNQLELLKRAGESGKKVVVVVYSGGEIDLSPWADKADAILMAWYTGQEGGRALADILTGRVSPSGRLPFTFWGSLAKNPSTPYYSIRHLDSSCYGKSAARYGKDRHGRFPYADYSEGIFVGYRAIGKFGSQPLYPFGYGLTYTTFEYSDLRVSKSGEDVEVKFSIRNTGKVTASEAAQVYVAPQNPSVIRPVRELKEYAKVTLAPGESREVVLSLPPSSFSHYDVGIHDWTVDRGGYLIEVGASALDIRLSEEVIY
ncbi:MAG: glycoside hydrolase family 3 C-terminal domain-containing protein, partial [Candidatus Cryptobacteroides sp.]